MKKELKFPLNGKFVAMLAPSFVVDFSYPEIIFQLRELGFDKVVELTFGAKMVNRDYHRILKNFRRLMIASVCPGITETITNHFPEYKKNLMPVVSPMVATAKICKKVYPKYKIVFISPCNFKKSEALNSGVVDYVLTYKEVDILLSSFHFPKKDYSNRSTFDKFYNDYTKIYPVSGGLSKTAHLRDILKSEEVKVIDGIAKVIFFLKNPDKKIKFLDVTFCKGGCIGGPCVVSKSPLFARKSKVLKYMKISAVEKIPLENKGVVSKAKGISFLSNK